MLKTTTGFPLATRTWSAERKHRRRSAKCRKLSRRITCRQTSTPVAVSGYRTAKPRRVLSLIIRTHTECMHRRPRLSMSYLADAILKFAYKSALAGVALGVREADYSGAKGPAVRQI